MKDIDYPKRFKKTPLSMSHTFVKPPCIMYVDIIIWIISLEKEDEIALQLEKLPIDVESCSVTPTFLMAYSQDEDEDTEGNQKLQEIFLLHFLD